MAKSNDEVALLELEVLLGDMRSTNVRSYGLKPTIHEDWVKRLEKSLSLLKEKNIEHARNT